MRNLGSSTSSKTRFTRLTRLTRLVFEELELSSNFTLLELGKIEYREYSTPEKTRPRLVPTPKAADRIPPATTLNNLLPIVIQKR